MIIPKKTLMKVDENADAEVYLADVEKDEILRFLDKPNYYAILPTFILHDKELNHLEKLLYAKINALSNMTGYCFASNEYLSSVFGNSTRTIRHAISNMANLGFISLDSEKHTDNSVIRKIWINRQKETYAQKQPTGSRRI